MSVIKTLTLISVPRPTLLTAEEQRRNKLITHLNEQLGMAKADIDGTHFSVKKRRWELTQEGGKNLVEIDKRLKRWWTINGNEIILAIKWGNKAIELDRGKNGIAVKDMQQLVILLQKLIKAAEAGELDALVDKANKLRIVGRTKAS